MNDSVLKRNVLHNILNETWEMSVGNVLGVPQKR